ncbi:cytochrome c [Sedimenticola hydrogenitrophicus]|uniref:cytochrome c n=1 Tax=Sedimenticola hydrogenitrophicus TaxID=2967975 RepID=UPI0021A51C5F|nr:cytochrome c [Sedimenticola hydrogenitrophicus]
MVSKRGIWLAVVFIALLAGSAGATEKWLPLPPASIAQWYKPHNERQVWLHTMFSLRREMQAVAEYAAADEPALARQWTERFSEHYLKIAEMVPEWRDELDYQWLERLRSAAQAGDREAVALALRKLGQGCKSCHREYRAVTALLYRTPDFGKIQIKKSPGGPTVPYAEAMEELSTLVNRIKIATDDNREQLALASLQQLRHRLDDLGTSCADCHKDPASRERYLGKLTNEALQDLERGLKQGDKKLAGRSLGSAAVYACARCHAVHRTPYDMRDRLLP